MPDGPAASAPSETIYVTGRTVACDGGDGSLGHPRVFLYIEQERVMCPYCSRLYIRNPGEDHDGGH
jgi:uncharacterized Zn-finger protein